ncbi:helix-turn-helix domain-containing protein [Microvirga sp. M2]|uniref:helix-turn-helix domain-containing protein n=1 Tax=Microvirga sp. M2 TaxID=3073270 RepID=UPI0039C448A8
MNGALRQRIGERVSALKISWRRASLEAGLEAGFIQDIITGRASDPGEESLASLAAVLKCTPAYLLGHSDELTGGAGPAHGIDPLVPDASQRPDAVMALRIVDELLAGGHVDAARLAVRRALKSIAVS